MSEVLPVETLVLDPQLGVAEAARAALAHTGHRLPEHVVLPVDSSAASASVVPVTSIFAGLASVYRRAAFTDALTGLPNRLAVHDFLSSHRESHATSSHAVLYVDLDDFRQVNDAFGHRIGDTVLLEFAQRLRGSVRDNDLVARLGGDEFVVLLRDVDEAQAVATAERIVLTASAPFVCDRHIVTVGASVGIALTDPESTEQRLTSGEVLLRRADAAMYRAKRQGRRGWAIVDAEGLEFAHPHGLAAPQGG